MKLESILNMSFVYYTNSQTNVLDFGIYETLSVKEKVLTWI